jgi:hypothetical protein
VPPRLYEAVARPLTCPAELSNRAVHVFAEVRPDYPMVGDDGRAQESTRTDSLDRFVGGRSRWHRGRPEDVRSILAAGAGTHGPARGFDQQGALVRTATIIRPRVRMSS